MPLLDDLNLTDFTGCIKDIKQRPAGGIPHLFVSEFRYLDLDALTFDADGCVSAFGLLANAPFIWLQPTQDENTTGNVTSERATPRSASKYNQSFTIEVPSVGKDAYILENILKNACDLIIFEYTNCCEVLLHGITVDSCGGTTSVRPQLQGLRFQISDLQYGTLTADRVKTWNFAGVGLCPSPIVDTTLTDLMALKTNCAA